MAAKVELNIGGTWTDVTDPDVRAAGGLSITRGRGDWQSQVQYGRLSARLASPAGRYGNRNPLSPYFGQLTRNTPIRVGVDPMSDDFGRTVVDGWGTSSSGHAWTIANGTAADFDVTGTAGTISTATSTFRVATLPNSYGEVDMLVKIRFSSLTGNPDAGIIICWQDVNNHYRYVIDNSGGGQLRIERWADGGTFPFKVLDNASFTLTVSTDYWLRASFSGAVRAKVWQDGNSEPDWMAEAWLNDPSAFNVPLLPRHGKVGLYAIGGSAGLATFDSLTVDSYRFHGEVSAWPPRKADNGDDVTIPIQASGILRRLTRSSPSVQSPMYREATKPSVQQFTAAYWPCEDGTRANQLASAVPNAPAITFTGPVNPAQSTGIPGSKPLAVFGAAGNISGYVPSSPDTTGKVYFRIILDVPDSPSTIDGSNILNIYLTGGSFARCALIYNTASSGSLEARAVAADGSTLESASLGGNLNGTRLYMSIELAQSGGNISFLAARNEIADDNQSVGSGLFADTWVGLTVGRCYRITAGSMEGWGFGHVGVGNDQAFMFSMASALIGNSGETAGARLVRIADEAGIALQLIGDPADTTAMGPQVDGSAMDVLRSCEAADSGILYESRNELGLSYRTRASMQNQTGPVLDYAAEQVTTLDPTEDDQGLYNDITVSRIDGSSSRATLESGPLSAENPPDGVGRYEAPPLSLNVQSDDQLPDRAWWELHQGTWDEQRLEKVGTKMFTPAVQADPDLVAQLAALDTGDALFVDNPPDWLPPDRLGQMVQGYVETIGETDPDHWKIDWNSTPYGPWVVAEVDGDPRVPGGTDFVLTSAVNSSATSLLSQSTSGEQQWCTTTDDAESPDDFPFDINLRGERVTVTDVGQGLRDTFTRTVGAGGWGTATDGHPWTIAAGTASTFSVNGSEGLVAVSAINTEQHATVDLGAAFHQNVRLWCTVPVTPTGAGINWGILLRYVDPNNYYWADVQIGTDSSLTVRLIKRVAGTPTQITTALSRYTHSTSTARALRAQILNTTVRAKVWPANQAEPSAWDISATDSDLFGSSLTAAGAICRLMTGNTNGTVTFRFDNAVADSPQVLTVDRSVNGVPKSHPAGAPMEVWEPAYAAL